MPMLGRSQVTRSKGSAVAPGVLFFLDRFLCVLCVCACVRVFFFSLTALLFLASLCFCSRVYAVYMPL